MDRCRSAEEALLTVREVFHLIPSTENNFTYHSKGDTSTPWHLGAAQGGPCLILSPASSATACTAAKVGRLCPGLCLVLSATAYLEPLFPLNQHDSFIFL